MCGIVGVMGRGPVNQLLYDSLLLLQHRGQDAAGIATSNGNHFNMYKAHGLVKDVFRTRNMRSLPGTSGIGQVRYPTAGSSDSVEEAQPFYVNAPFGITVAHNGNLTNWRELRESLFSVDRRHINTNSDSEVLLNVLAHELQRAAGGVSLDESAIFRAVNAVHRRVKGAYAVVAQISGYGLRAALHRIPSRAGRRESLGAYRIASFGGFPLILARRPAAPSGWSPPNPSLWGDRGSRLCGISCRASRCSFRLTG